MSPSPATIREARLGFALTTQQAADLLYLTRRSWQAYEDTGASNRRMPRAQWEYFLIRGLLHSVSKEQPPCSPKS